MISLFITGTDSIEKMAEQIPHDPELKRVFESYCKFGEPTNTKLLKSSKFFKLMHDCGLVKGS